MTTETPTRHVTFNMIRKWKLLVSKGDGFCVAVNMEKIRHVSDNAANIYVLCHSHWKEVCHFFFSSFLNDAVAVPLFEFFVQGS